MYRRLIPALLVLACGPAAAHHSASMFDQSQRLTLKGTVREFQWRNPHCYVQLLVEGPDGAMVEWSIEAAAPMYLQQSGWKPSSLKPGDAISVIVTPHRKLQAQNPAALLIEATRADGSPVGRTAQVPQ
jgi:hypothetical protein